MLKFLAFIDRIFTDFIWNNGNIQAGNIYTLMQEDISSGKNTISFLSFIKYHKFS
jgi:hypothetical protein